LEFVGESCISKGRPIRRTSDGAVDGDGRDIPVALQAGRPRALYLPDTFDAGPDVSNWMTAGHPTQTRTGNGISVAARAGSADRTVE